MQEEAETVEEKEHVIVAEGIEGYIC